MNKPKLSFWQIWNLSFGFLGVQVGYSLQNSNTSSIFESLGADVSHLSYFWLAAPLAGMIVQPIVGLFSDGTWMRFGRRIPYILGGSLVSALALELMPNCPRLLAFAPLAMGVFILLFMDLSFNVTMQPFRALVADMLDDSQKTQGYVVQTFLINLGAVAGAVLPLVMTWLGVSDEAAPGAFRPTSPIPIMSEERSCCLRCSLPRSRRRNTRPRSSPATTIFPKKAGSEVSWGSCAALPA